MCAKFSDYKSCQKCFRKNITNIPPIIDNGIYISYCKQKADIFNEYFLTYYYQ